MVFENVLSTVLNSFLGDFVENLDGKQLNVGIWGGDVELKNLIIKPSALDDLDLPVQVVYGKIGQLVLKIPWKSLYTSPTIISVEDIYILVEPNQQVKYNAEKEEKMKLDTKKKEIEKVEAAKKAEAEKDLPKANATFVEKLITNIIKNVQLTIKNIHIRYEDRITNVHAPFALGITLSDLSVESTDENWKKAIVDDISKIYKIVQLEGLSVYWNCNTKMYSGIPVETLVQNLHTEIASKQTKPNGYQYILGPINASARLRLNQKPENDSPAYTFPKVHVNLDMEKLYIGVSKSQYRDIIALASSMDRMAKGIPYRKYRPNLDSYKGNSKAWWQFAYKCILEEHVRRRRRDWDWNHISQYRNKCKEYRDLYTKQTQKKNLNPTEKKKIEDCEKSLDLTNIVIIRQRIQFETERLEKIQSSAQKKTWLGWMWGSSSKDDMDELNKGTAICENTSDSWYSWLWFWSTPSKEFIQYHDSDTKSNLLKQIEEEMTPEEKKKLYRAIDYQENAAPATYPEEYVDNSLAFLLRSLEIELLDDQHDKFTRVMFTHLKGVKVKLATRVAASALSVQVKIQDFSTDGMEQDGQIPEMITSDTKSNEMKGLLDIKFEKNPIDKRCDQRIEVIAMPIKIIYDAQTINKIVNIFQVPTDTSLDQIQAAADDQISNVKNMTATGLQYAIDKHLTLDLNIDFHAPYVVIPYGGKYTGAENVLVLNLGRLKVCSFGKRSSMVDVQRLYQEGKSQKEILEFMRENCYDNFLLELMDLQILVAQSDEDWLNSIKESVTTGMHLLQPLSLKISLSKCLLTDDARLPHLKIRGELPSIDVTISEARLLLLAALGTSIEFPSSEIAEAQPLKKTSSKGSMILKYKELQESAKQTKKLLDKLPPDSKKDFVEFTTLDAQFVMSDLSVTINQQVSVDAAPVHLVTFKVHNLKLMFVQQTYNSKIDVLLESISSFQTRQEKVIDIIKSSHIQEEKGLFKVEFIQVDPKSPYLHSTYKSCETSLNLNFAKLTVVLHQEGLLAIMAFVTSLQEEITQILQNKKVDKIASAGRRLSTISESKIQSIATKTKKVVPVVVESIKFKLKAALDEFTVKIATDAADIASCGIIGINTVIIVKDTYTQVDASLRNLSVIDLNPLTRHNTILSRSADQALQVQIVLNNLNDDSDKPDMAVTVKSDGIRIFFLNWFVTNILNFLDQFQTAQQKIIEASQAAAESARENVKDVYAKATKISLTINLKAPVIVVPVNSQSFSAILLDLGTINLSNTFITLNKTNSEGHPAVVDQLEVALTDLTISRIQLNETSEKIHERYLLEPTTFNVAIKRNLSAGWYKDIPDINISGKIQTIKLLLAQADYQMVMAVLSGNLTEGQTHVKTKTPPMNRPSEIKEPATNTITTISDMALATTNEVKKETPHIFLKFTFAMEQLIINLFTGGSKDLSEETTTHYQDNHLARLSVEGLSLKGRILDDQSLVTSVLLVNCILDDMRKGREDKLNRLIGRSQEFDRSTSTSSSVESMAPVRSMIDVTFQQNKDDMFADVRVYSFTIILSVDYLLKIADFFNVPKEESVKSSVSTKAVASTKSKTAVLKEPIKEEKPTQMTINLKLEKPDIILVEHMDNINTNAIIVNSEILLKLRMAGEHQIINGVMKELSMYTCIFNPERRADTRNNILHPLTISVAGSTPEGKGLHVELLLTTIHLCVCPATIELLNKVIVTVTSSQDSQEQETEKEINHTDLWQQKPLVETELWYLKTDSAVDALGLLNTPAEIKKSLEELCIISMPKVIVTIEAGVGTKTLPMLIFEASFKGLAHNWSSQLQVEATLSMLMGYYNSRLALWEPLIEPVEVFDEKGSKVFIPWELKLEMSKTQDPDDTLSTMSPMSEDSYHIPQPLMSIDITSSKNLELTITKTLLEVLQNLGKAFASAIQTDKKITSTSSVEASFKVLNEIGEDITLKLEDSSFQIAKGGSLDDINKSFAVPLQLKPENVTDGTLQLQNELGTSHVKNDNVLVIKVNDKNCQLSLPVMRADRRYFMLNYRSATCPDPWSIISDVKVDEGTTIITIRSILQVYNYFNVPIDVYYMTIKGNELELIGAVQPKSTLNIPLKAVYTPTNELFFAVSGYSISNTPYTWKDLQTKVAVTKILQCTNTSEKGKELFFIKAIGEMEQVFYENTSRHTMASTCFNIRLRPAVIFKNCLPVDVVCCVDELAEEFTVTAGETLQLPSVDPGNNALVIRIPNYLEKEWSSRNEIQSEPAEFAVWTLHSYDSAVKMSLNLGMHTLNKNGSLIMSLYCPFWMLNKTGVMLAYRNDENLNVLHHPPNFKGPILFSFNVKNFFGKKKASIRVESGEWSDKFSLDVAGSSGVVNCKSNSITYNIGVHNQLTYNGLTKQITFTPYYVIINNAPFAIECQESDRPADPWFSVLPKSCTALWPKVECPDKSLKVRVEGTEETSAPFLYSESHNTLLVINNKFGGIIVDLQLTEGGIYINLSQYENGSAPALLVNDTDHQISYWEKDSPTKKILEPHHYQLYTWENPSGPRLLVWDRGHKKEIQNDLRKDIAGEFSPSDNINICWASFLDGLQRVLLFTEDRSIAEEAQASNIFVQFDQEITVSLHGLGISLVNNLIRQEIMYIGIASSGIIWESCKLNSSRFKQLDQRQSTHIEHAYQHYLLKETQDTPTPSEITIVDKDEIDFSTMLMYKPQKRKLRRTFQTGLWLQMKNSPSQMQLHAKVNRLQIDNQMYDCIFPVVLAPVPPPKSVAADSGIKPFVELSIVQLLMKNSQIRQFKYFKILVQEFDIKVDLGFVNAIVGLFSQSEQSDEEEKQLFLTDMKLVDEALYSHASTQSIQEQKSFYDLLHFSPLKIHVSFTMASGSTPGQQVEAPNFLNVLLQGLGVTLTDLQDVVFKLAFFERSFMFLTQKQLISEVTNHYTGQAVKQLYVLVLGLDVLGNPYGLVVGLTKGVEDLFYEPFQGAIQGPGEFAEGLALGVRSLFGHTVGGAAGAISRITGAVGKGIAALSFDDEFQRKRREQLNLKPSTAQEGIARSGKGLVMGVYSGVTGVITKPVTGAREQGVEGFFKGLGKGAVGLVVKPVAGVVDFASGSLDVVKRAADTSEDMKRLRPPRFLQVDGLVRPYQRWEAEGNKLLAELSKGKYAKTDIYVYHYTVIPKKEILLITDKRLAYICHNDLFGGWQMEWSYTWDEIIKPPQVVPKGVLISTSEKKKKLFGSSDMTKTVLLTDPIVKEDICVRIESLRGT